MESDTVRVAVRIRPLNEYESIQDSSFCVTAVPNENQIRAGVDTFYSFDNVFGPETSQADLYEGSTSDLLTGNSYSHIRQYGVLFSKIYAAVFEGFNATILAYGQTGSGKTFTMGSSADQLIAEETAGIIPRFIKNLFHQIKQKEEEDSTTAFKVYVQFLEIYGEDIRDLLDQTKTSKVVIRETRNGEVFITGAKEEMVSSFEQMMKALEDGTRNRTTASTKMNLTSSRSHAIFTVNMEHIVYSEAVKESLTETSDPTATSSSSNTNNGENEMKKGGRSETPQRPLNREVRKSKFHFVDLAGSERAKRTGASGLQLKEGIEINKGLLALGNVISALGDETKRGKVYVPYRDSKLTRLLRDSLGGNSKTLMICCVSPAAVNYNESLNALRYANRARNIKNKPVINRDPTLVMVEQLRNTLRVVSSELLEIRQRRQYIEIDSRISNQLLEQFASDVSNSNGLFQPSQPQQQSSNNGSGGNNESHATTTASTTVSRKAMLDTNSSAANRGIGGGGSSAIHRTASSLPNNITATGTNSTTSSTNITTSNSTVNNNSTAEVKRLKDHLHSRDDTILELKRKLHDSEFETKRTTELLKFARQQTSEVNDQLLFTKSEVDYYKLKWQSEGMVSLSEEEKNQLLQDDSSYPITLTDLLQEAETADVSSLPVTIREKVDFLRVIVKLRREMDSLRKELFTEKSLPKSETGVDVIDDEEESNFTATIANLIAQTRVQLQEESRKLSSSADTSIPTATTTGSTSVVGEVISEEQESTLDKVQSDELEEEREYAKRTRLLTTEVQELGQTIHLKEQLLSQLVRSQEQYIRMKTFYEQRLLQLSSAMQEKEDERAKLLSELQELSTEKNETQLLREQKLREEVKNKDEELKNMKKKQQELRSLAQAQSQYTSQLLKLETDIQTMKKQRVDLTKTLQQEKRNHIIQLSEKAKEIDKLKKELLKASNEVKRLGKVSETAETKINLLKRKVALSTHETNTTANTARLALKAISNATSKSKLSSKKVISEEEIKTRKWITQRITEIATREISVEMLKREYEQQLELLQRQEELESDRNLTLKTHKTAAKAQQMSLTKEEEEKMIEILEDRLSSVNGQLNAKSQIIANLRHKIAETGDILAPEKAVEVLRKNTTTLSSSYELIRLLFEMLIQVTKTSKLNQTQQSEFQEKETFLQSKIDDLTKQLSSEKRLYDMEVTGLTREYEEKYQNLFTHIAVVQGITTLPETAESSPSHPSTANANSEMAAGLKATSPLRRETSFDPLQMQLSISAEETKFLKQQLEREMMKYAHLQQKFSDFEKMKTGLTRDIAEKNNTIRFLEEERSLFKSMAEEMKAALHNLGKDGKLMIQSIKGKASRSSRPNGLFNEYLNNSDSDDDTESVLGEFDSLVEEINRTGNVTTAVDKLEKPAASSTNTSATTANTAAVNGSEASRIAVFDRVSNPNYFTGSIKTVFKEDLAGKRLKTQFIRNQEKQNAQKREVAAAAVAVSGPQPLNSARDNSKRFFADEDPGSSSAPLPNAPAPSWPKGNGNANTAAASGTAAGKQRPPWRSTVSISVDDGESTIETIDTTGDSSSNSNSSSFLPPPPPSPASSTAALAPSRSVFSRSTSVQVPSSHSKQPGKSTFIPTLTTNNEGQDEGGGGLSRSRSRTLSPPNRNSAGGNNGISPPQRAPSGGGAGTINHIVNNSPASAAPATAVLGAADSPATTATTSSGGSGNSGNGRISVVMADINTRPSPPNPLSRSASMPEGRLMRINSMKSTSNNNARSPPNNRITISSIHNTSFSGSGELKKMASQEINGDSGRKTKEAEKE